MCHRIKRHARILYRFNRQGDNTDSVTMRG